MSREIDISDISIREEFLNKAVAEHMSSIDKILLSAINDFAGRKVSVAEIAKKGSMTRTKNIDTYYFDGTAIIELFPPQLGIDCQTISRNYRLLYKARAE